MNSLNNITDKILSDSRGYADATLSAAQKRADAIRAEANAQADRIKADILAKSAAQDEAAQNRAASANALAERNALLNEKIRLSDECFSKAAKKLSSLPDEAYLQLLKKLYSEACEEQPCEIIMNSRDAARVGKRFEKEAARLYASRFPKGGKAPVLSNKTADIDGGFILRSGSIDTNCSVSAVVRMNKDALEAKVLAALFA